MSNTVLKKVNLNVVKEKLKSKKFITILIVILSALALILILFNNFFSNTISNESTDSYETVLERKLENILLDFDGITKVNVAITLSGGEKTILASKTTYYEENGKIERTEEPILVNGNTVVIQEIPPEIQGVLIVTDGANNISVIRKIEQATTSLLNVSLSKIEIIKMK